MKSKTQFLLVLLTFLMMGSFTLLSAQTKDSAEPKRGWAARAAQARAQRQAEGTSRQRQTEQAENEAAAPAEAEEGAEARNERYDWPPRQRPELIVGTWLIDIPQSNMGLPPFRAYHTFADGGTFTEVSDLLVGLGESPAHGVWRGQGTHYNLTFELFAFDPEKKEPVGIVRVRVAIRLLSRDELVGETTVDFIAPDGTIEKDIDGGPFSGKRVKVRPLH